jgi:WD40 repeat protein
LVSGCRSFGRYSLSLDGGSDLIYRGKTPYLKGYRPGDCNLRMWEGKTGKEIKKLTGKADIRTNALAFSPDGRFLISGGGGTFSPPKQEKLVFDCDVHVWDVKTGEELRLFPGPTGPIHALAFTPDGKLVVCGSESGIYLWDFRSGELLHKFVLPGLKVESLAVAADNRTAAVSLDRKIYVLDLQERKEVLKLYGGGALLFLAGGKQLLSLDRTLLQVWDVPDGKELRKMQIANAGQATFSADGK